MLPWYNNFYQKNKKQKTAAALKIIPKFQIYWILFYIKMEEKINTKFYT